MAKALLLKGGMTPSSSVPGKKECQEDPAKRVLQPITLQFINLTLEVQCLKYVRSEREVVPEPPLSQNNRSAIYIRSIDLIDFPPLALHDLRNNSSQMDIVL